ncbi:hypothetical protein GCM10010277_22290 [Streptomyces longisporoflavus]|uniref:hypothetical protein n=1 Tax=Streptomyces longisporoflavus TaxID=28044 RepID=UPI00167C67F1|nr:hypothetical protein [Streptomyces longisporoflavus]GGV36086.1 hypothetical protein GCM10010277_22290 [Streptomyces longisporoflavus]
MTYWWHRADAGSDDWFETGEDAIAVRQASFRGPEGGGGRASVAAARSELAWARDKFELLGAQLYEATYGALLDGPVSGGEPVSEAEFEDAWQRARHSRNTTAPEPGGPLPRGTRLTGTVSVLPWGPGRVGLFVDPGLPVIGFVDLPHLPFDPADWPDVGTVAEFEVTAVRFRLEPARSAPQIRLRPTATPPPGLPWPRPGRP